MTTAEFQRLLDADPFEPFTVTLSGGTTTDVTRPEWAGVTPHGSAGVRRPDGWWCVLSLDHVVSITYPDQPVIR